MNSKNGEMRLKMKRQHPDDPDLFWCPKCETYKTREKFSINKSDLNGIANYCRSCRSKHRRTTKHIIMPFHSKEWLIKKYIIEKLSPKEIADSHNVSDNTIRYWLRKYGIQIRSKGMSKRLNHMKKVGNGLYCDKDYLKHQYINERKSSSEIAKMCSVSPSRILDYLCVHNIPRRDVVECHKSSGHKELDKILLDNGEGWFENKYEELQSVAKVAECCGVGKGVMDKWLVANDISLSDDDGRFKKGIVPVNKKYEGGNREKKRIGREELHDWYVLDRLRYAGVVNSDPEMIELKKQAILMHRNLKQFKQWREQNEPGNPDVQRKQQADESDYEGRVSV